jgi:hypothetical protein
MEKLRLTPRACRAPKSALVPMPCIPSTRTAVLITNPGLSPSYAFSLMGTGSGRYNRILLGSRVQRGGGCSSIRADSELNRAVAEAESLSNHDTPTSVGSAGEFVTGCGNAVPGQTRSRAHVGSTGLSQQPPESFTYVWCFSLAQHILWSWESFVARSSAQQLRAASRRTIVRRPPSARLRRITGAS